MFHPFNSALPVSRYHVFRGERLIFTFMAIGSSLPSPLVTAKYEDWNSALRRAIESFSDLHSDASVFLFSSYQLFDSFLRNPLEYNLKAEDVHKAGGEVWIDHLHPTSKVHDIIASNLANFLNNIDAMPGNDPDREDTPL